jgi:hypothetical protein
MLLFSEVFSAGSILPQRQTGFRVVFVNGVQASFLLSTRLSENAEIHFAPAIAGGSWYNEQRN